MIIHFRRGRNDLMVGCIYSPVNRIAQLNINQSKKLWQWVQQVLQAGPRLCEVVIMVDANGKVSERQGQGGEAGQIGGIEDVH